MADSVTMKVRVREKLREHLSSLNRLLQGNINFAREMFAADLILEVSTDCDKVLKGFEAGLLFTNGVGELQDRYASFLRILEKLGGPAKVVLCKLIIDWPPVISDDKFACQGQYIRVTSLEVVPTPRNFELEIDHLPEQLARAAYSLQRDFNSLVVSVRQSLICNSIDLEGAKILMKLSLSTKVCVLPALSNYIFQLQKVSSFLELFRFLIDNHFIGYLNYILLKKLAIGLVSCDANVKKQLDRYEQDYATLFYGAISFQNVISLFEENPNFTPSVPVGLPYISFRFERPWLFKSLFAWFSTFGKFSWSNCALLAQLRKNNCVIVSYAILPYVLPNAVKDLNNPEILNKLRCEGVNIELSAETETKSYWERRKNPPLCGMSLPVTMENYKRKYRALLCHEEEEHVNILHEKCDGVYDIVMTRPPSEIMEADIMLYGYLDGLSPSQMTYATQASSYVTITMSRKPLLSCKAKLLKYNNRTATEVLYVGFDCINAQKFKGFYSTNLGYLPAGVNHVDVVFEVKYFYFTNLHNVLNYISNDALRRVIPLAEDFLEGFNLGRVPKTGYSEMTLDKDQFRGLQTMLFTKSPAPVLIPGPFGCGKTRLLSVATEYILTRCVENDSIGRVLLCCYQQKSADIVMTKYFINMSSDRDNPWKASVIRVTSERYKAKFPSETYGICISDFIKDQFDSYYSKVKQLVVVTTYGVAMRMSGVVPQDFFTHIFIDEGAQTRETETLGPLLMANRNTRIIIAGDTQQVGPKLVVLGDEPQKYGLGESLLQRLYSCYVELGEIAKQYIVFLRHNYRCHEDLLEISSNIFYDSDLIPCSSVQTHSLASYPLKFVCSDFEARCLSFVTSSKESAMILNEVKTVLKHKNYSVVDVCIIASSLNQANLIRQTIYQDNLYCSLKGLSVLTSYEMQGQEFSMIFLSTVECLDSSGRPFDVLKSLCQPAVFNTVITRSKCLVVAFGNPLTLLLSEATIEKPKWCWREFIDRCRKKDTFFVPESLRPQFNDIAGYLSELINSRDFYKIKRLQDSHLLLQGKKFARDSEQLRHAVQFFREQSESQSATSAAKHLSSLSHLAPASDSYVATSSVASYKPGGSVADTSKCLSIPFNVSSKPLLHADDVTSEPFPNRSALQDGPSGTSTEPCVAMHMPKRKKKSHSFGQQKKQAKAVTPFDQYNPVVDISSVGSRHKDNPEGKRKQRPNFEYQRSKITFQDFLPESIHNLTTVKHKAEVDFDEIKSDSYKHKHEPYNEDLLKAVLSRENYKAKYHQLLCCEEEEHKRVLSERCNGVYTLIVFEEVYNPQLKVKRAEHIQYGLLYGDQLNGDVVSYIKQASSERENVIICFHSNTVVKAEVVEIVEGFNGKHDNELVVAFTSHEKSKLAMEKVHEKGQATEKHNVYLSDVTVTCSFVLKWSYFDRLHKALDNLSPSTVNRLIPRSSSDFEVLPVLVPQKPQHTLGGIIDLDQRLQLCALKTIMSCQRSKAPVLVIGSFGTGKTRLLARAAYQILQENRLHRVLICAHHQHSADTFITNYFAKMKTRGWYINPIRLVPSITTYKIPPGCSKFYVSANSWRSRDRLVVTTFSTSLNLLHSHHVKQGYFTHILLDEGAQSREPESVAPLCLANDKTQIVIAGDHKQVGPSLLVLGETAMQHGLNVSLLERLHKIYHDGNLAVDGAAHCATLMTNYRCHHAILSLPSYLFYDSTLTTAAESVTHLCPPARNPFHFICSSLSDVKEVKDDTCSLEVDLLLEEVKNYRKDLPEDKSIGIIATTPNQRSLFFKRMKNEYKSVEVLNINMIQGREFDAIFLSTTEPTTEDGKPTNPTKTPCSQYVFNTVLTRAKSLVVCAGNPFLLMTIENHFSNEISCWKEYIKRCILSQTFIIPDELSGSQEETIHKLQDKLFLKVADDCALFQNSPSDSIMSSYHNVFQKNCNKKCKMQLNEVLRWQIDAEDDQHIGPKKDPVSAETIKCELSITSYQFMEAIPCNNAANQSTIKINSQKHRRGAFDGDIVSVKIIGQIYDQKCGEVVSVLENRHQTKYICTSNPNWNINFYPLDKSVPSIVNLPRFTKGLIEYNSSLHEKIVDENSQYITVFSSSSLLLLTDKNNDQLPQIKDLIPHETARNLLFIVQVLAWSPKYRLPLGAVIEAFPRTSNIFFTERLLKVAYDITEIPHDDHHAPIPIMIDATLPHYDIAFTIDSPDTVNMDDALSLTRLEEPDTYELAVHISNVASFISQGTPLDNLAKKRGISFYGTPNHAVHMLPIFLTDEMFSLKPKKKCHVLTVSAKVVISEEEIGVMECFVSDIGPKRAMITSQVKLTYEDAQKLMDSEPLDDEIRNEVYEFNSHACHASGFELSITLNLLYKLARKLRKQRIGVSFPDSKVNRKYWQSDLLVSELMIWANSKIAEYLINSLPDMALVRRQLPPSTEKVDIFCDLYQAVLPYSSAAKLLLKGEPSNPLQPLAFTKDVLLLLHSNDYKLILWALSNDLLYPQLAQMHSALRLLNHSAEYKAVAISKDDAESFNHMHFSLNLPYTHFTSPMRRYFDLLVQRLVIALMEGSDIEYTPKKIDEICKFLNQRTKVAQKFDRTLSKAKKVKKYEKNLSEVCGFLAKEPLLTGKSGKKFQILIDDLEIDTKFDFSHLNVNRYDKIEAPTWHIVSASLCGTNIPLNISQFSNIDHNLAEKDSPASITHSFCKIYAQAFEFLPSPHGDEERQMKRTSHVTSLAPVTYQVDYVLWKQIQDCLESPSKEFIASVIEKLPKLSSNEMAPIQPQSMLNSPVLIFDVNRSFNLGEELTVKIGKSLKESLPTPCLQSIEVAPGFQVCLQHNRHPSLSFSDVYLPQASRMSYSSLKEYVELWSKVLVAEAANDGIGKSRSLHLIRNVCLEWPKIYKVNNCVDNEHYEPVMDGEIAFIIGVEKLDILNFIKIQVGDLACVRYNNPESVIYHFVITATKSISSETEETLEVDELTAKENFALRVVMKSIGSQCWISETMKDHLNDALCDIQVVPMPVSFNRVFKQLQKGANARTCDKYWSKLIRVILASEKIHPVITPVDSGKNWQKIPNAQQLWSERQGQSLNEMQQKAIDLALKWPFCLIQGPPGTGKSVVGAHLAYIFSFINGKKEGPKCSVLYCCPSNKAVDVVHKKLQTLNKILRTNKLKLIRLYGRAHERYDFPNPCYDLSLLGAESKNESLEGRCLPEFKEDALHYKIRLKETKLEEMRNNFCQLLKKDIIPSLAERKRYRELINEAEKKVLSEEYDIILCTCNETCSGRLLRFANKSKQSQDTSSRLSHCIIDECGMATEPEAMAAASLCEHVVLIGDHKQLQPIIHYQPASESGLSISMFERYANKSTKLLVRLNVQYRMHETICAPPSKIFYNGSLDTVYDNPPSWVTSLNKFWIKGSHIKVYDIRNDENDLSLFPEVPYTGKFDVHSIDNEKEANEVLKVTKLLHGQYKVPYYSIAVLTPYAKQKETVKRLIKKDFTLKDKKIKVTTIVESQGDEHDIVILSTVRTLPYEEIKNEKLIQADRRWLRENLGFLIDEHQMNVGITRAKHGLIVIGDVTLLKYVEKWKEFFSDYTHAL